MADCKNTHGSSDKNKTLSTNTPSLLNRSVTISSSSSSSANELSNKPLFNLYNTPPFQRNGSIKSLYNSSFGSMVSAGNSLKGKVRKLCSLFESPKHPSPSPIIPPLPSPSKSKPLPLPLQLTPSDSTVILPKGLGLGLSSPLKSSDPTTDSLFRLPGTEDRVVIYFTSLRGIRKTFQDCHSIRMIFRGFRVNLDERDISMDVAYRKELEKVLGETNVALPQVFVKGKYIGGADVVRQLLEAGELVRLVKGIPLVSAKPCDGCDDVRFVPCSNCSGSRKVFDEDEEQPKRCPECNENGLVRCPLCSL